MRRCVSFVATLLCCTACPAESPTPPENLRELVDQQVGQLINDRLVIGAAVGVVLDGTSHEFYLGSNVKDAAQAPTASTLYEIGSITKVFTGTALAAMHLSDALPLDTPVSTLLPAGTVVPTFREQAITLAHLAEQNSGLPRLPDNFGNDADPYANYTAEKMYAFLLRHQLRRAPGAEYEYSNLAVGLLGHALALRAGQSYEAMMQSRILTPLGMTSTYVHTPETERGRVAQGYGVTLDLFGVRIHSTEAPWTWDALAGAGALRSTLPDMMRFLRAAMGGDTPLKEAFALSQQQRFEFAPNNGVGLNWHLSKELASGSTLVWHNGGTGGYHSFLGFRDGVGVVVLANTSTDEIDNAAVGILDGVGSLPR